MAKNLDAFELAQRADYLSVYPRNGCELAGPVGLVVRPRDPRCIVLLPLRGHPAGEGKLHSESAASKGSGAFTLRCRCHSRAAHFPLPASRLPFHPM